MPRYLPVFAEFSAQGYTFSYEWSRKAVKNFNLRVRPDGSVAVSTPTRVTKAQLEAFLLSHLAFIAQARKKMTERHPSEVCMLCNGDKLPIFGETHTVCLLTAKKRAAYTENGVLYLALPDPDVAAARVKLFRRFAAEQVSRRMGEMTAEYAPYFLPKGALLPAISLRWMKSRWGACFYQENRITYNTALIFMPPACLAYVACHELAHFRHSNHSSEFYAWLARVLPNHRELRQYLHTAPVPRVEET